MKLRRLGLENFRRHRRTVVEFQDGVTAIVGPNGAGKSTLLEGIAFALYGPRAAATGKDLIRSEDAPPGDAVRATLEFDLGGQAVRVVRELRGKSQSPLASLEVGGHVLVQPIAGSSEQVTQQVEHLLGLDRDGFFQTVVARQRELNLLSQLKPAERRAFVLDLVGIGAVDAAIARAREQRNSFRLQADEAARHVGDAPAIAESLALAEAADVATAAAVEATTGAVRQAELSAGGRVASLESIRSAHAGRAALEAQATASLHRAEILRQAADRARADVGVAEQSAVAVVPLRQRAAELEQITLELSNAQGLVLVRGRRSAQLARLQQEEAHLQQALTEVESIQVAAPPDLAPLILALEAAQTTAVRAERMHAVANERLQRARADGLRLQGLHGAAPCPTCNQPVTGEHLEAERRTAADRLQAAQTELAAAVESERTAHTQARTAREALATAQAEAVRLQALARRRDLATHKAAALQSGIAALREALPPDPGPIDLEPLQRRAVGGQALRMELAHAEAAAVRLPALRTLFAEAERGAQSAEAHLADLRLRLATQPETANALAQARAAADAAQAALASARQAHTDALLARQAAGQALRAARDAQDRDRAARARVAELQSEVARWTAVVGAAGGGLLERFREHLVARTAPAINHEASHLLALFTRGRYTELVVDESYEVWMGDAGVLHPIERFSGGEQDLAYLALRLGISRLLATRAHAPEIRFLALDEVFSSLDAERCDALLAALQRIGGLYSQILAVTHLERLRETVDAVVQLSLSDGESVLTVT